MAVSLVGQNGFFSTFIRFVTREKKGIASSHVTVHPFNGSRRSVTVCIPYYVAVAAAELKKIANVSNVAVLVGAVRGRIRSFGSCASMCI